MSNELSDSIADAVAVVGMHGCFPGAHGTAEFWRLLSEGREAITVFTEEELAAAGVPELQYKDPRYVRAGMVLDGIELFDARFFGVNPREAEIMDPQLRLLLECAWTALEKAGCDPAQFPGSIGVYAGAAASRYYLHHLLLNKELARIAGGALSSITQWNDRDSVSTLISYKLNLRGPSVTVQSACSTALVAVHLACQSLLNGETDMALAGGVSISIPQNAGYLSQEGMILSPDGHCRPFDARAAGTIFGSGGGMVVLRRLEDALGDGYPILAVIRGSAVNNDGSMKGGYTAPSVSGQAEAISEALSIARVKPSTISYVEAHGTGTELGDPIEVEALTQAFRSAPGAGQFCALGSVKSNIGHLDRAAGVASFIKVVLALQHRQIPASLHFETPNPKIDFGRTPFFVNTQLREWTTGGEPRRAGVSSLGIGGTNVHIVLEEAPPRTGSGPARRWQVLPVSGMSGHALEQAAAQLAGHLRQPAPQPLADIAWTLQTGRRHFEHRAFVVADDAVSAASGISSEEVRMSGIAEKDPTRLVFLFSGQGAQYPGMGRELYEEEKVFREIVDAGCMRLGAPTGPALKEALLPAAGSVPDLSRTAMAQPALFLVEYAMARLWMSWGLEPAAMIGHSLGEYVAACLAGVFTFEEALCLVSVRGRLMESMVPGSMLSVPCEASSLAGHFAAVEGGEELSVAAINAPGLCTVSGPESPVRLLEGRLKSLGLSPQPIHTSHAFHSAMMDPMLEAFRSELKRTGFKTPSRRWISNLTGTWIHPGEATDPEYWLRHLRSTVQFSAGVQALRSEGRWTWLEVGPGRTLSQLVRRHFPARETDEILTSLPHAKDGLSASQHACVTLGRLWLCGMQIQWAALHDGERRHRVELPTYPFEREKYWVEAPRRGGGSPGPTTVSHSTRRTDIADWFYQPVWTREGAQPPVVSDPTSAGEVWWILGGQGLLDPLIGSRLEQSGKRVVWVSPGADFRKLRENAYQVDPDSADGFGRLVSELCAGGLLPARVLHLWSLGAAAGGVEEESEVARFEPAQRLGFRSLVSLARAIDTAQPGASVRLDVVADGVLDVIGDEPLCPEKATLIGPCRVIAQECPGLFVTLTDLPVGVPGDSVEWARRVVGSLLTSKGDPVAAFRGRHRWIGGFASVRMPEFEDRDLPLKVGGVYLITGGLGDIGFTIASWLARDWKAKIVLVGRSPVKDGPESGPHSGTDEDAMRSRRLKDLRQMGAEVWAVQADVADELQMRALMTHLEERYGELNGVFHAAGILTGQSIREATVSQFMSHFRAKALGMMVLSRVLAGRHPRFVMAISSLSAVLGGAGTAAYAAANAFMDAYVMKMRRAGEVGWQSVQWDSWDFGDPRTPFLCLSPVQGVDALRRCLGSGGLGGVVAVSVADLPARVERWVRRGATLLEGGSQPRLYARRKSARPFIAPSTDMEKAVAVVWMELLGVDSVSTTDDFFELGGHSLMGTQVISRLRDQFGVELPLRALFEASTLGDLAKRVQRTRVSDSSPVEKGPGSAGREEIEL